MDEGKTIQAIAQVPADVAAILDRSCKDCHSSMTRWPWYSTIAPVSWYLVKEVKKGRKLSNADRRTVCAWAKQERARVVAAQADGGR